MMNRQRILGERLAWLPAIVVLLTAAVLFPVVEGEFLNWDDPGFILENPLAHSLKPEALKGMFTSFVDGNYQPLTFVSYAIEHAFVGTSPFLYHLDNLLLHLLNVLLVYILGSVLVGNRAMAALTALLFGLHPTRVETVAWITERRNLLAAAFSLAAMLAYVRWARRGWGRHWGYAGALVFMILAVLSKQVALVIPVALLLLDRMLCRPFKAALIWEKIPFFVIAGAASIVNLVAQKTIGAINVEVLGWGPRYALIPLHNLWFYVQKTVVPTDLSAFYAYPSQGVLASPAYLAGSLAGAGMLVLFSLPGIRGSRAATGFWFYVITIIPPLRLLPAGNTAAADRYLYLPGLGLIVLFFSLGAAMWGSGTRRIGARSLVAALAVLWITFCGIQTRTYVAVWQNSTNLWTNVLLHDPDNFLAHFNLGTACMAEGNPGRAEMEFTRAIELKPFLTLNGKRVPDPYLHVHRGLAKIELGKDREAIEDLLIALGVFPGWKPAVDGLSRAAGGVPSF